MGLGHFAWHPYQHPVHRGWRLLVAVASYTQGAAAFASSSNSSSKLIWNGQNAAFGHITDAVYGTVAGVGSEVQLTTVWSVAAAYEHYWTPNLHTSFYGSYLSTSHNSTAKDLICGATTGVATSPTVYASTVAGGCNPDFSQWNVGSRSQWDVTKGLYLGVDVLYTRLQTARVNAANTFVTASSATSGVTGATYTTADQSAWVAAFRIHRDIVP